MGNTRNLAFWVVLFLLIVALFNMFSNSQPAGSDGVRTYSEFIQAVDSGQVAEVQIAGENAPAARGLLRLDPGREDLLEILDPVVERSP